MNLWLVRHGATDWSDAGRFNGRTDIPLNARGREQAMSLRGRLSGIDATGVWSSDATRAIETARLALSETRIRIDPRLAELDFGTLEGLTWDECSTEVQESLLGFEDFTAPGGESVRDLRARVSAFRAELPPGDHVVVTHGGVIRSLLRSIGQDRRVAPGEIVALPLESLPADNR